ncbi:MAG: hypothetical protein LBI13_06515, partial [Streptococcaceae bacterium]|nr:hypothetical protein [Streptococcaceae bacterium]
MIPALYILIFVGVMGYALYKGKVKKDFAKAHNVLKDRPGSFYRDENIFLSEKVFSLSEIYPLLEKDILDNYKLKYGQGSSRQEIFFQHLNWSGKSEWTSRLTVEQKQGNAFRYKFRITHMITGSRSGD